MNDPSLNPPSEQEFEIRITAVVLGEASEFERDQIDRLIEQRPELVAMKARIESVHQMLHDVGNEPWPTEAESDWKLPSKQRAALLDVLDGESGKLRVAAAPDERRSAAKISRFTKIGASVCAACLLVALGVWVVAVPKPMASMKSAFQSSPEFRAGTAAEYGSAQSSPVVVLDQPSRPASGSVPGGRMSGMGDGMASGMGGMGGMVGMGGGGMGGMYDQQLRSMDLGMSSMGMMGAPTGNFGEPASAAAPVPLADGLFDGNGMPGQSAGDAEDRSSGFRFGYTDKAMPVDGAENQWGSALPSSDMHFDDQPFSTNDFAASPREVPLAAAGKPESAAKQSGERAFSFNEPMAGDKLSSMRSGGVKRAQSDSDQAPESNATSEPFSTFSLHVSDVSFKLAAAALAQGQWPEAATVRMEEFVNALDYGDPLPSQHEMVACEIEQAIDPFMQQRNLLRVSLRTAAAGRAATTPLRLTLLLDNSGSMERMDRQQTVRRAFETLTQQLQPGDQITLISFARTPRLLADRVSGEGVKELVQLIENLPSDGGTNIEAALQLAWEKAREQRTEGAQNRIILLTDGAVNLGDADPERLSKMVRNIRDTGISFDAAGISANGLNDEVLEALTRKGDGRYYLLDSEEAADANFARQIAGALRPAAMNVKVQIEFNPERVGQYRLLGFEKHRLSQEDFRDDLVDAAEMSAAEAGVAIYQFEPLPGGEGDVGSLSVRFREMSTGRMIERRWPILYQSNPPRLGQAPSSMRLAAVAAMFAAKLGGGSLGATVDLKTLSELLVSVPPQDRIAPRVRQLEQMIQQARRVSGG